MILVTGCARSATGAMSLIMQAVGFNIYHEKVGTDGTSDYRKAVPDGILGYDLVIHVVRNPIRVIGSLSTILDRSRAFMYGHIGKPPKDSVLFQDMWIWLKWNEMIEWSFKNRDINFIRVKAEESLEMVPQIPVVEERINSNPELKNTYKARLDAVPKKYNWRPFDEISWLDIKNEDETMFNKIQEMGRRYGYGEEVRE